MASTSELLVKHKFIKKNSCGKPEVDDNGKIVADEEKFELFKGNAVKTGYPKPIVHFRLVWESPNVSMENVYFWITTGLRNDCSMNEIIKLSDVFGSSQSSSFFGASQARLGVNQDRASQLFAQIGKMVKDLFQLVREIRVIDQKLDYYDRSMEGGKDAGPAEIALKGIWIDQVEGGMKNPGSVLGLAKEVGFVTLPDLFFSNHPQNLKEIPAAIERLKKDFNRKVCEVLSRKLYDYLDWKTKTYDELKQRKLFTIKFLRQHYNIIKMYMDWVKPYLKFTKLLSMKSDYLDSPDLISAFEGSLLEVEVLGKKSVGAGYNSIISAQFNYRTTPTMPYHQDEYRHKGPLHVGRIEFNLRAYAWTDEQVKNYVKMRGEEDLELLGSVNDSIKAAMDALGDDLKKYLEAAGEHFEEEKKKEEKKSKRPSGLDPFVAIFKGFGEIGGAFIPRKDKTNKKPVKPAEHPLTIASKKESAAKGATAGAWNLYKNFKKANKLMAW